MPTEKYTAPFKDAPGIAQLARVINGWHRVELPEPWRDIPISNRSLTDIISSTRDKAAGVPGRRRSRLEVSLTGWLFNLIQANIKRGRIFTLGEVLRKGQADCLGYAKLFTILGRLTGLDTGVIEIPVDNAGRYVPHTACLVKLPDGRRRFVDLWYGSDNIRHRRAGLRVRRGGQWNIEDIDWPELPGLETSYLSDSCVDAMTCYIQGNRYLNGGEFSRAIEYYSEGIRLYPENARLFYNRAVAYESLGQSADARQDYARALRDDSAVVRVRAIEHEEISGLIDLDERGLGNKEQEVYLLYAGFITGRRLPPSRIARRLGLPAGETKNILAHVKNTLYGEVKP